MRKKYKKISVVTLRDKLSNGIICLGGYNEKIFRKKSINIPVIRCKLHVMHGAATSSLISNGIFAPTA